MGLLRLPFASLQDRREGGWQSPWGLWQCFRWQQVRAMLPKLPMWGCPEHLSKAAQIVWDFGVKKKSFPLVSKALGKDFEDHAFQKGIWIFNKSFVNLDDNNLLFFVYLVFESQRSVKCLKSVWKLCARRAHNSRQTFHIQKYFVANFWEVWPCNHKKS